MLTCRKSSTILPPVRVEWQRLREGLRVIDCGALSTVPVTCYDVQIVSPWRNCHACRLKIVTVIPTRQEHLTDGDADLVEHHHAALAVNSHIEVTVAIGAHRIWSRTDEMVRNRRADWRDGCRVIQLDPVQEVSAEFRDPQVLSVWAERNPVRHREAWQHGRDRFKVRRHVVGAALRLGRDSSKVTEVKAAARVEHQVVWHIAGCHWNNRLHTRSVRLHSHDRTRSLSEIHGRDEDATVPVNGQASWSDIVESDNR